MLQTTRLVLVDDRGQGLVEYALVIAFIAIVCVAALNLLGQRNNNSLSNTANKMPG
jgi:pilus assembly protein Flp/PilA